MSTIKEDNLLLSDDGAKFGVHGGNVVCYCGADLTVAEVVIISIHGRFATARRIIEQLEDIIGHQPASSKIAILAPQADSNNWYPGSFLLPQQENEPQLSQTMEVIDACVRHARKYV